MRFIQATVQSIDPAAKRVETDAGSFDADILVVALGADPHPSATPGLIEGGHEFYTVAGAFALSGVLDTFEGGRVIVGVTSTPFKSPPAPSETALLMHDFLTERGLRGTTDAGTYDGRGMCYLEFGRDQIAKVDVTFLAGQSPSGMLEGPSETLVADKAEFGTSRIRRWFGQPCPATADA